MILLTFRINDEEFLGVKTEHGILDVAAANRSMNEAGIIETVDGLFSAGLSALPALQAFVDHALQSPGRDAWLLDEDRLEFGPSVPRPGKIICVGLNYRQHALEAKMEIPPVPLLFAKYQNAVAASGEPVPLPQHADKYDYEAELVVVIGKRAKYVAKEQALDYVLGYCNGNDFTERALQGKTSQWMLGKSLDKFLPLGPYLLTADEAGSPQDWPVRCWVNNELRQDSNTSDMIFAVDELVSFISRYMTLEPGDIIATGTPQGVILGMPHPRPWMKPGDSMTVEVGPLGRLTNPLVQEQVEEE